MPVNEEKCIEIIFYTFSLKISPRLIKNKNEQIKQNYALYGQSCNYMQHKFVQLLEPQESLSSLDLIPVT